MLCPHKQINIVDVMRTYFSNPTQTDVEVNKNVDCYDKH